MEKAQLRGAASEKGGLIFPWCVVVAGKGFSLAPPLLCCAEWVNRGASVRAGRASGQAPLLAWGGDPVCT